MLNTKRDPDETDAQERPAWDPYAVPQEDATTEQSVGSNLSMGLDYYKRYRRSVFLIVIIIFIAVLIYGNATGSGTVSVQVNDEAIGVAGPNGTTTILMYEDVVSVAYYDSFEIGTAVDAYDSDQNYEGTYENDLLGEYNIIAYQSCEAMIVITTSDGTSFAFNRAREKATQKDYASLTEAFEAYTTD